MHKFMVTGKKPIEVEGGVIDCAENFCYLCWLLMDESDKHIASGVARKF